MNLLVFRGPDGTPHFFLQRVDRLDADTLTGKSWWTRLRSQIVASYRRLRQHFAYQERMLGQLRHAQHLRVRHAVGFDAREVRNALLDLFRAGVSKHTTWFLLDALVAGLGGILAPLPGPNVFFFYPAIRALGHYLARRGARHAGQLSLTFEGEPLIDEVERSGPVSLDRVRTELRTLEERYFVDSLGDLLESEIYEH